MQSSMSHGKVQRMTGIAILTAIIVVVQIICTFIKFGPFSITLALAPIIIGAAVYGVGTGAMLGGVFGLVVLITGILGWDGGTVMLLMGINPVATVLICIIKGAAAGLAAGAVYAAIAKKSQLGGVITAGVVCPVVNTGLFIIGMLAFFFSTISGWAAGNSSMVQYIIFGLCGGNFIVELATNLLLATAITRIIRVVHK